MAPNEFAFLNLLPLAAAITDRDGTLMASNGHFRTLVRPNATGPLPVLRDLMASLDGETPGGVVTPIDLDVAGQPHVALAAVEAIAPNQGKPAWIVTLVDITERAHRERELFELSLFPLMNPSPVLRFNRVAEVVLSNPAAEKLFALGPLIGRKWEALCPGMTVALWQRVLTEVAPPSIESQIGAESVRFAHVVAPSGEVITAFGVVTTDFRRAERALDAKAKELAELARFPDMNPGPVVRTDFDGLILLANTAARAVFGDALVGMNWRKICSPVASGWDSIVHASQVIAVEARLAGADYVFNHRSDPRSGFVFVYGTDITGQRRAERRLLQSEKMATLGTLAAGITHELNNPAAATRRAADQLRAKLAELTNSHLAFNPAEQGEDVKKHINILLELIKTSGPSVGELSAMEQSDREYAMESWLEERAVPDPWQLSPDLVSAGIDPSAVSALGEMLDGPALASALTYVAAVHNVATLSYTVTQGSGRISEIVQALKSYSYLGQAPVQAVDLREGIENTLVILRNKLKYGITVRRDYQADLPPVPAYGSELNQVWTNIIDNAADAMGEHGEITIRTKKVDDYAVVEIEDTGPGIPEEIKGKLFDPFFTTKAPGKGMGLGLATTYSIVTEKHRGRIQVESRPGSTVFIVSLPLESAPPSPAADGTSSDGAL